MKRRRPSQEYPVMPDASFARKIVGEIVKTRLVVPSRMWLWSTCAVLALGGCDCEDRVRRALSDPGSRGEIRRAPDGALDQGVVMPSSTEPEEVEPNDARGEATRYELGKELRTLRASIGKKGDEDWYLIGAPEDELLEVSAEPLEETLDVSVALMSSDDTPLRYEVSGAGKPEVIPWLRLQGGQAIAMKVTSEQGQGAYRVRFRRHLSAGTLEAEPNEIWSDALALSAGVELQGFYDRPGDVDRYRLEGDAGTPRRVEVSGVEGMSQRVALTRDEQEVWSRALPKGKGIVLPNLGPGEWGLELMASDTSYSRETPYRLRVMTVAEPKPEEGKQVMWEQEPNDPPMAESVTALAIGEQPVVIRGSLLDAEDEDVLRFETTAGVIRVRLESKMSQGQVWMRIGGSEEQVWLTREQGVERCIRLDAGEALPHLASVVIGGKGEQMTPYELEAWGVLGGERGPGDEVEPNGEMAQATPHAGADIPWRGYILEQGDRDWYEFEVEEVERAVSVSLGAHELDLSLSLRDEEGGVVADAQSAGAGGAEEITLRLPQGKYKVRVEAQKGSSCEPYEVRLSKR